jgi:phosphatidylethanolamine/phosphatidyl-N-methylethanolamine N-methyltransferase
MRRAAASSLWSAIGLVDRVPWGWSGSSVPIMHGDLATFPARFLRHPLRVGAIAPSSVPLAGRVVAPVPGRGDPVVVELGPGTGVFTRAIQERLSGRGYHLAVEADPVFAAMLRRRYPRVDVVFDDAVHLPVLLALRGLPAADVVISGLRGQRSPECARRARSPPWRPRWRRTRP